MVYSSKSDEEKKCFMKKYLRHLSFRNGDGFDVEDYVNSDEFKNCELITISTYVNDDMEIVHELWYWFIAE